MSTELRFPRPAEEPPREPVTQDTRPPDTATQRVLTRLAGRVLGWAWKRFGGRKLDRL